MLKCATSLWSADLANLEAEIKRVSPYSERFHIDVADGHCTPALLFFPDLVAQLRPHTEVPFEVHLYCTDPLLWLEPFAAAGADIFMLHYNTLNDVGAALQAVRALGKQTAISLEIEEPVSLLDDYLDGIDTLCLICTEIGIKGAEMAPTIPDKVRAARDAIDGRGLQTVLMCDGGIRRHSVPLMAAAGADYIVPGSLMFKEDPAAMRQWLATLQTAK